MAIGEQVRSEQRGGWQDTVHDASGQRGSGVG